MLEYNDDSTRATLAQTFGVKCHSGERKRACRSMYTGSERQSCIQAVNDCAATFTVAVNHFKGKQSSCDDRDDPDADDGQVIHFLRRK